MRKALEVAELKVRVLEGRSRQQDDKRHGETVAVV